MTPPPLPSTRHHGLADLYRHFPARRRWQSVVVLGMMLLGAVAEVLTIGAVLPFLVLVGKPDAARSIPAFRVFLDLLGLSPGPDLLGALAILFCLVAVGTAAVRIALAWATQKFVFRLGYDLGVAVYRRILYQPYSYHVARNSSEVLAAFGKVQQIVTGVMMPAMLGLSSALIAIFIFGALLLVNAGVALISGVGFSLIYVLVSFFTRRRLRANGRVIAGMQTARIKTVQEGLGGIRDVLIDHAQPIYLGTFARADTALRDAQAVNALIGASPRFVIEAAGMVMIVLVALILSTGPGGLVGALPVLGALALGAQRMLPVLQLVYNGWAQVTSNQAAYVDVLELLAQPIPPELLVAARPTPLPFRRALTLEAVSFRYHEHGPWVLRDISLDIARGARVGFVGRTGSGKSTIMDLVMGLLQPGEGMIRIDGEPLTLANTTAWQAQIAHVPQQIYLSDATMIENIAFGVARADIDEDRARRAATQADIAGFIDEQPAGYETIVGERGVRLSGGQRQRIGIARALYKRSALLVFDEATSALDDATEASVMSSIDRLGRDLTVLMIAHRLSTLRNCDVIYRLDRGEIVQRGTYADIIADPAPVAAR